MLNRSRALTSVAVIAMVTGISAPAWAETLQEALALAYRTNPSLLAQRANQRALDESIVQARAGLRPTVDVTVSGSYSRTDSPVVGTPPFQSGGVVESDSASATVGVGQNIWTGGRIGHAITSADAQILAGRENLRDTEQSVLALVIQSYADVIRDTEILSIREANLGVLRRQLEEASARFEVGEITRTDVAQSEARLAQSEADLANARAQLSVSRAAYAAVVGQSPGDLAPMPVLPGVPTDFDNALDVALIDNPGIRAAGYSLDAAEANVAAAKAEYLPSLRATASYGGSSEFDRLGDLGDNTRLTAGATPVGAAVHRRPELVARRPGAGTLQRRPDRGRGRASQHPAVGQLGLRPVDLGPRHPAGPVRKRCAPPPSPPRACVRRPRSACAPPWMC